MKKPYIYDEDRSADSKKIIQKFNENKKPGDECKILKDRNEYNQKINQPAVVLLNQPKYALEDDSIL